VKSAVETLNPTRVRLTVEVPFEELKPSLDAAYKKIAGQVSVPGFRRGKVPPAIIDQRFGRAAVLEEAVNDALPRFYGSAVQEQEIRVLGQPHVDIEEFADGSLLKFTAEVDVRPEIDVPEFRGLEVTVADADVTDEDVQERLDNLRARFAALTTVDRPAESGDFVSIDLAASTKEGQAIEDAQAKGLSYEIGSGSLIEGLDEAVVGLSVGESRTFGSKLLAGPRKGEEVDVEVTVQAVKIRELPEADDEFAQSVSEFDTIEELRADIRERSSSQKRLEQGGEARDKVLEALLAQLEIPLPQGFLDEEVRFRKQAIANQLSESGLSLEHYLEHEGQTKEEFEAEIVERAQSGMRAQFLLDAIAAKEEVTVNQEELTRHLIQRAATTGLTPDQFAQQVVDAGQAQMLVGEVVRSKALAMVMETATIKDESGRTVDLKSLRPGGADLDRQVAEANAQLAAAAAAGEMELPAEDGADDTADEAGDDAADTADTPDTPDTADTADTAGEDVTESPEAAAETPAEDAGAPADDAEAKPASD
jgi:trigger factor